MPLNQPQAPQYDFAKNHPTAYFDLLRLARVTDGLADGFSEGVNKGVSESDGQTERESAITVLNQLPQFEKAHKRIIPLLNAKALKLEVFNALSPQCQQILTKHTQQGIVTELAKKQQLTHIIEKLAEHNIPLILLKGAAFAGVLYSPQAPRTSNDLDILIQSQHWQQAVDIIKQLMDYTAKEQPDVFGDLYELSFTPKNKVGAALDLHSSLIHPLLFNINEQQLWDCSVEHPSFNNEQVRVLSPEHALIHQALHAYKDMDFAKYNLVDSYEIINAQKPDIQKIVSITKEWGASIPLFVLLKNCLQIMASDIKTDLLKLIKPNFVSYKVLVTLLKSRFTQPLTNQKTLRYRLNQIVGQFIFTGSVFRPLALQWLFVSSKYMSSNSINI